MFVEKKETCLLYEQRNSSFFRYKFCTSWLNKSSHDPGYEKSTSSVKFGNWECSSGQNTEKKVVKNSIKFKLQTMKVSCDYNPFLC